MKDKVRPIYKELRGYLYQAPDKGTIADNIIWDQYNSTIEELNALTGNDFNKFKIEPNRGGNTLNGMPKYYINSDSYRMKLNGLINKIHALYFSDDPLESNGNNVGTVINANQFQSQSQQQSLVVDLAMLIAEKKNDYQVGTPERSFLDKAGEALKKVTDINDILKNIIQIAITAGVGIDFLAKIFK